MKKSRLSRIANWPERAVATQWRAFPLAADCGMSPRELRRFAWMQHGCSLRDWLKSLRLHWAADALHDGCKSVKAVARDAGYKSPNNFSRDFKRFFGYSPGTLKGGSRNGKHQRRKVN